MANAYKIKLGMMVDYLHPIPTGTPTDAEKRAACRWQSVKVVGIVSQNSLNLSYVNANGTRTPINAGAAIAKRTAHGQTDVWRPY